MSRPLRSALVGLAFCLSVLPASAQDTEKAFFAGKTVATAKAPEKDEGAKKKKDFLEWAADMKKGAEELATAAKAKDPQKVKTAAASLNSACNNCHNPLFGHGGSRLTVEMCILCHTPQTINPDTKLTQDMNVLIHKIHMGKNLPSVKAGGKYQIIGFGQAVSDWSSVVFQSQLFPSEIPWHGVVLRLPWQFHSG